MSDLPTLDPLDRRLNLIDETGKKVDGEGSLAAIKTVFTELRERPDVTCAIDTQLMFGENVMVHDICDGWAWVQAERDRYAGWLDARTLQHDPAPATHIVCVPRTFLYPEADLKLPHKGMRSMGSGLRVVGETENRGTAYALLEGGEAIIARHIRPVAGKDPDPVSVAETLLRTPYLWAGTTTFGLDCSGLVKLAHFMCGQNVLRDSDMQAATLGEEIDPGHRFENILRGDCIFWRGHVGLCQGAEQNGVQKFIHANGNTMDVSSEPLLEAVDRIVYLHEAPIGVRRPLSSESAK